MTSAMTELIEWFEDTYNVTIMTSYDVDAKWFVIQMDRRECHLKAYVDDIALYDISEFKDLFDRLYRMLVDEEAK